MTAEDIKNAIASGDPLNINTRHIPPKEVAGGDPEIVSGDLANELSLGFETTSMTDNDYITLPEARL